MAKIQKKNQPLFNVLETVHWRITNEKDIELTFDSSVMILEFDKNKEDFVKKVRKQLNNFHIKILTAISKENKTKSHIKSRREIYEELVQKNPSIEKLRQSFGLDIENEP